MGRQGQVQRVVILAIMIALDFLLSPIFRIEGMAPMSSVMNVIAAVLMGPTYAVVMAIVCALMRMLLLGIPPLAFTGAVFGALLAGILYRLKSVVWMPIIGEIIGTGLIGSLASYPVMVLYTGTHSQLFWFVFTPRFFGGAIIGSVIAYLLLLKLTQVDQFKRAQRYFLTK
ncbi:energy coupling factor transporter S component ThiW (plasmid) [Nicoliella spurrieriana]|uniref:Energy coupling factor transporter S component ThiW n=1 Tax=Nicoliella spurrieriana TaxID=2925830 RepID=A0A976RQK3_9LACO|nr:energy coupling factor transporter S component ThiW [Nicoliella spurrieriana]UQS86082.1 energy coupling factor transporter S component ThiW [Nicoliella spurrieriana]